nr:Ig-like domain-containing protein [Eubacterium sp.]
MSVVLALALVVSMPVSASAAKKQPKLNKTKLTLKVGKTAKLKVKNTKKKVKWSSSKKKVATVKNGKVTAKKVGKTTITAKVGKKKLKCKVTVTKKASANNKTNKNNTTTPTSAPTAAPVSITTVSVVNARTIHVVLSSEQELSKDKFTVKMKEYANGTYNRTLSLESVTTTDKKTYVIKVDPEETAIPLNYYVQVTVDGLLGTGIASKETFYAKVGKYTDDITYSAKVGDYIERSIHLDDTYGYVKITSVEVPTGFTYEIEEKNERVNVSGTCQQTGVQTAVIRYEDELGNTYEATRRWVVGDSNTIAAYCRSSYGVVEEGQMTELSTNFYISGGSGEYRCEVTDPSTGTYVSANMDEDDELYGYVNGNFGMGTANVQVKISDANNSAITTSVGWTVNTKVGKRLYVNMKDATGNRVNAMLLKDAYAYAYNTDVTDLYVEEASSLLDEKGMYFILPEGSYDVKCNVNFYKRDYYGVEMTGIEKSIDMRLPFYSVTLTSSEIDLTGISWYDKENEMRVGENETVFVEKATELKSTVSIDNVFYRLEAKVTNPMSGTAEVVIVSQVNQDGGTITLDSPIETTLAICKVFYKFVPEESGYYCVYSTSEADTYGYVQDGNYQILSYDDDSGDGGNFKIVTELEAGKTYYLAMRCYGASDEGAAATITVRRATEDEVANAGNGDYDE